MRRVHFLLLAIGIALSTAFVPACGPARQAPGRLSWGEQRHRRGRVELGRAAPQTPGRVSWAEQLVQKAHNVPVSRLHIVDSRWLGGSEKPVALVEAEFTCLDFHGKEKKARTKLYLPDKLQTDPTAKVPLYYLAGYEVIDQVALSHVQRGWVVVCPAQVKTHPLALTANSDLALLHIARSLPFVDDAKVVIGGGSAGGYMALLLAAETFPLAGAVTDVAPMNWGFNGAYLFKQYDKVLAASFTGQGREMPFLATVTTLLLPAKQLYGTKYGDLLWFRHSPLCHLSTITCPVSALWSTADMLVPMQQIGDRWVRPFDPKEFLEGFTMDPARLTATREGRLRLTDVLADEEYEVFTVPVPDTVPPDKSIGIPTFHSDTFAAGDTAPLDKPIELPVSARKRWSVTILDEGPPRPKLGHFKHNLNIAREEFFRRILNGSPPASQLTAPKLERLMDRYAGKEWLPTKLKHLDYAESERADVLRGLTTYVTASPENAQTFTRLYRQLPPAKRVLEPQVFPAAPRPHQNHEEVQDTSAFSQRKR